MAKQWTPQEQMLLRMTSEFTANEIAPLDLQIDHAGRYPDGLFEQVVATGFLSLMLPNEFGGAGFGPEVTAEVVRRVAEGNASMAATLEGHYKTVYQMLKYGTPALQAKYFSTAGQRIFGFGMTEPTGGSNPMSIRTTAVRQGSDWVLNGNKIMITNGGLAEVYCVLAKTGPQELSVFVVDQDMPGFAFGKRENFIGLRGTPVGEIFMNDVRVSDDYLLGQVGQGGEIGDSAHDDARILMGAVLTGIMDHALGLATSYAKERKAGSTPIGSSAAFNVSWRTLPWAAKPRACYIKMRRRCTRRVSRTAKKPPWPRLTVPARQWQRVMTPCKSSAVMATAGTTRWRI